jgi:UDP-N-acetylglucosamine transferase subunit ALG13
VTDAARVVVSVGTDHHPFDRLIDWIDTWTAAHPEVPVLVQRGSSRPPRTARSEELLGYDELVGAMAAADAVVVQGGPAGIVDARGVGHRPVVVARRPELGEHVDGHQVTFTRWMADRGQIDLADDEVTFHRLLDDALADPARHRVTEHRGPSPAVAAFAEVVDPLLTRRRDRTRRRPARRPASTGGMD